MRKIFHKLVISTIVSLLVISCTFKKDSNTDNNSVLNIGNGTEPKDLDPHIVTGVPENNIISALMEGLVVENPKTLEPLPGVAKSWKISNNGKTYTFLIGANRKWSDGTQITAHDFLYSWHRILNPKLASEYSYMLYPIKNAEEFNKSVITDFSKVGIKAENDSVLIVTLKASTPYFISVLSHFSTFPVNRKCIENFNAFDNAGTNWTKPGNFIGNGPYVLERWELNKIITVKKSKTYWDRKNVKINLINFYPIDNATTEERMFRAGLIDITSTIPSGKIESYKKENPSVLHLDPYLGTYYYRVNITRGVMKDKRVRKAISMAINRKSIVENILKGGQIPAYSFVPPNTAGFNSETKLTYSPDSARTLLKEAGYPHGKNFPTIELLYNTSEGHRKIAVAIQQMLKKELNINLSLVNQDWKVYLNNQKSLNFDIARAGWIGDYPDPNTFLDMFVTGGGNNQTGWSNTKYDSLINEASLTNDKNIRFQLFNMAETILLDELPIIPIYTYTRNYLQNNKVRGWYPNILDHHPYKFVELVR